MSQLSHESAHLQSELQGMQSDIANRLQPAVTAAQQGAATAQAALTAALGRIPALEAAVAQAEDRIAFIDQQAEDAKQEPEPDRTNMLKQLAKQRAQAQAALNAARTNLNNGRSAASQASANLQAAQAQVNTADAALTSAGQQLQALQQQLDRIARWNAEISADPLVRPALQQTEQELAERTAELENACDWARIRLEIEQETLAALLARHGAIPAELQPITDALPGASAALQAAQQELERIGRQLTAHYRGGPGA